MITGKDIRKENHNILNEYDIIYLLGGNPLTIRENIELSGLNNYLTGNNEFHGILISVSGSTMFLSQNFSLFKLLKSSVEDTIDTYDEMKGLGIFPNQILPHYARYTQRKKDVLSRIKEYSKITGSEIYGLYDGGAIILENAGINIIGKSIKILNGTEIE